MNQGGIFQPLGSADLAGQTMALAPGGSAPLATAMQQALNQGFGYGNLPVDGKWGDCSEKAFLSAMGQRPTPGGIVTGLELHEFGVSEDQVQTWDKSTGNLYCGSGSDKPSGGGGDIDTLAIVSSAFGVPNPSKATTAVTPSSESTTTVVPRARLPRLSLMSMLAPSSEKTTAVAPRMSFMRLPTVKAAATTATSTGFRLPRLATAPSSDKTTVVAPSVPRVRAVRIPVVGKVAAAAQRIPRTFDLSKRFAFKSAQMKDAAAKVAAAKVAAVPGAVAEPGATEPGATEPGATGRLGTGAMVAIGAVVLGVAYVGGYMLWKRSKSAVPNYHANCWTANCGE